MSTLYTPSPNWSPTIQRPVDGEDIDAASVNVGLEALADRDEFLREHVDALEARRFLHYHAHQQLSHAAASGGESPTFAVLGPTVMALFCKSLDTVIVRFHLPHTGFTAGAHYFRIQAQIGGVWVDIGRQHQVNVTDATRFPFTVEASVILSGIPTPTNVSLRLTAASASGSSLEVFANTLCSEIMVMRPGAA